MAGISHLSDEELAELGIKRIRGEYGTYYTVPCDVCGKPVSTHSVSTKRSYKCKMCKKDIARETKARRDATRREVEEFFAASQGVDHRHYRRFESGAAKFDDSYIGDIEKARKAIGQFDSVPEVMACIELLHTGARVITHQAVGDFTVDFCLPDEKTVVEIDGSLYHRDADRQFIRDNALMHMLGDGWTIRHVPADTVAKRHGTFGKGMKRMLNERRAEFGLKPLG